MGGRTKRMETAVAYVAAHPGATMRAVIAHVLSTYILRPAENENPRVYKQAAMVVERVIRDRLVRHGDEGRLYPWDEKLRAFAEAVERAANLAPDPTRRRSMIALAASAWIEAGDENRARILTNHALKTEP